MDTAFTRRPSCLPFGNDAQYGCRCSGKETMQSDYQRGQMALFQHNTALKADFEYANSNRVAGLRRSKGFILDAEVVTRL